MKIMAILDEQFGISPKEFDVSYNEDVPFAVGANQSGTSSGA